MQFRVYGILKFDSRFCSSLRDYRSAALDPKSRALRSMSPKPKLPPKPDFYLTHPNQGSPGSGADFHGVQFGKISVKKGLMVDPDTQT